MNTTRDKTSPTASADAHLLPGRVPTRTLSVASSGKNLAEIIRQRIESRMAGRIRNLRVSHASGGIVLEGTCSTYYSKQLAQHAALGVIEDEHLENRILVTLYE